MTSANYHTLEEIERLTTHHIEQNKTNDSQKVENTSNQSDKRRGDGLETVESKDKTCSSEGDLRNTDVKKGDNSKPQLHIDTNRARNVSDTGESEPDTAR